MHISFVVLTFLSFTMRGYWMMNDSSMQGKRWVRIVPHIIDTGLLVSGVLLVYIMSLAVMEAEWLLTKIVALLIYIVTGTLALKRGRSKKIRIVFFIISLLVFSYIVFVAITKLS